MYLRAIGYGSLAWYGAATFISFNKDTLFSKEAPLSRLPLLYAAAVPISYLLLRGLRLVGVYDIKTGSIIATAAACVLDGLALLYFPRLYGFDKSVDSTKPGAFLLWGVGWGLALSLL